MADSFNKKEREKKRQKRKKEKAYRREQKKTEDNKPAEFMYVDEDGNLTTEVPDFTKKKKTNVEDIEISTRKSEKSDESKYTKTGIVKFFNSEKGYGFIDTSENSESFFVHADNLNQDVKEGDHVSFEIGKGPKGPIATDVTLVVK
ncbi:MAG: cold shock CspA family protein [Neolewinella sp.]|jgi:cold shock CspA family protein|nr:cold shock domain-containing protein [Lewinella sp.]